MSFYRPSLCAGLLYLLVAATSPPARAQSLTSPPASALVRADLQARVLERDTLLEFHTRRIPGGRVDVKDGVIRAAYRIEGTEPATSDPVEAARSYLRDRAEAYGLSSDLHDLEIAEVRSTPYNAQVVFQQTLGGVPVLRRQLKVNLDRDGRPSMVLSGYAPHLRTDVGFDPQPVITASRAQVLARSAAVGEAQVGSATLFVNAEKRPRLIWQVIVWPEAGSAELEVLVDARTGAIASIRETGVHRAAVHNRIRAETAPEPAPAGESGHGFVSAAVQQVEGSGLVFDPDPVSAAGAEYGGELVDADDADLEALNALRTAVPLREITQGTDGLFHLDGPHVQIVGSGLGQQYTPPAEADPNGFRYSRAHPGFEAVMAYYHIDTGARYVESLDAGAPPQQTVKVNPRGYTADNSEYLPFQHAIVFGTGGIDDAEDGSVIRHEHAHAILNNTTPGLLSTTEGAAFHEGWADYWATSMLRHQVESGDIPPRDWTHVFPWDGNNASIAWCGRYLHHTGHYPEAMDIAPPSGCGQYPVLYQHGLLWATTLMEIYTELGRDLTDRLNLASHTYLSAPVTMADAAEALVQADVDLYDGIHTGTLITILGDRGFVDATAYGPLIAFDPVPNTESLGGTARIEVRVTGSTANVDSVLVHYGSRPTFGQELALSPIGEGWWAGDLPLPASPDTVTYYLEAVDELRRRSFLPRSAPDSLFEIAVGPDQHPPVITHTPITRSSLAAWPASILALVEDPFGVDSVWVTYQIQDSTGALIEAAAFGLEPGGGVYEGAFPTSIDAVSPDALVSYQIHARDRSQAANLVVLPEEGPFTFRLTTDGVLREYDFELPDPALIATGAWEIGQPTYGVHFAREGGGVWATNLDGPYPAAAQRSTLEFPPLNLQALGQTYLVFWHWHDLEHNGQAVPDSMKQIPLWDGANVKVSSDGGVTWTVVTPLSGYNGNVPAGLDNPLGGEPAFGGYSYGWRRVVIPLPTAADVRFRFDLGTDLSNEDVALQYAGWYLDDVSVVTELPTDEEPPVAVTDLPPEFLRAPGERPPNVSLRAYDDVGVARAEVLYEVYPATGSYFEGRVRLSMSDTSLYHFAGVLPIANNMSAGDRIDFRMRVVDYGGNEVYVPSRSDPPHRVLYRNLERIELLEWAVASGIWTRTAEAFEALRSVERPRSGLVMQRVDLPVNAQTLSLEIRHRYNLDSGVAGNVKISADGGHTWNVLEPDAGYPGMLAPEGSHPLAGEAVYVGSEEELQTSHFDLAPYAGEQIQLRLEVGSSRRLTPDEYWAVHGIELLYATEESELQIDRTLALHPNFPDPFVSSTLLSYTIPTPTHLLIDVYDVLGRRVSVVFDGHQEAGTFTTTFDGSRLAAGTYLLRLRANGQQRVERLTVVR